MIGSSEEALLRPASPDISEVERASPDDSKQRIRELEAANRLLERQLEHVRYENLALLGKNESLQNDLRFNSEFVDRSQRNHREMSEMLTKANERIAELEGSAESAPAREEWGDRVDVLALTKRVSELEGVCRHYNMIVSTLLGEEKANRLF